MEVSPNQNFEQSLLQRVMARQVDEKVAFQFVDQHKLYRKQFQYYLDHVRSKGLI